MFPLFVNKSILKLKYLFQIHVAVICQNIHESTTLDQLESFQWQGCWSKDAGEQRQVLYLPTRSVYSLLGVFVQVCLF